MQSTLIKNSLWLVLLLCGLWACNNNTEKVTLSKVKARSSKVKRKKKQDLLVYSTQMNAEESYKDIKGNVPRLIAMLSGRFVVQNTYADTARENFSTWLVNEGKDSVLLYAFPVGEPNRDGYWMYMYEYMTSLPESPLVTAFVRFDEINRDSIKATYYEEPQGFDYSLEQLLQEPIALFKEFNFEKLPLSETGELVYYKRETPLKYIGHSRWVETKSKNPKREGGYDSDYYLVTPGLYSFATSAYDKERVYLGRSQGARLIRQLMLSTTYSHR